jgi:large subunit ribosomal protein L35
MNIKMGYKIKTKSGAKKRFKVKKSGKIVASQAGKKHNMRKRSKEAIRDLRGTTILCAADARIVRKFLPNNI